MAGNLGDFESSIGFSFNNRALLRQAFVHRSYLNEHRELASDHNERLEFLGDAVLELVVTDFLFRTYPNRDEGDLTAFRSALVNADRLAAVADSIGMNDYLLLSKGESKDTGRARHYLLANAFEALVGAMYLDQGYSRAKEFIGKNLFPFIDEIVEKRLWQDAKSRFQEKAQELENATPSYKTIRETGPDHAREFVVGAYIKSKLVAQGEGRSKQEAEQSAAEEALKAKGW